MGLELLDSKYENELDAIEADTKNDGVATSCRKMFNKWLNTDELASWGKLIEALRIVKLNIVANAIEQLLLQGEYYLSTFRPGKVDSLFPISYFLNFDAGRRSLFIMTSQYIQYIKIFFT